MRTNAEKFYKERKGNCAQSVVHGWTQYNTNKVNLHQRIVTAGHGKAPDGMCGAIFAASELVDNHSKTAIIQKFKEKSGGHLACKDIRKSRALTCVECVGTAAEILQENASIKLN